MKKQLDGCFRFPRWFMATLLIALAAGCGGGGGEGGTATTTKPLTITAFSLAAVSGTINEPAKTISVTMPFGTNATALVATFTVAATSVKVGAVAQASGTTPNNFTAPVAYAVSAADGTTVTYTVTVTVAQRFDKAITAFSFAGLGAAAGIINESTKSIAVTVPNATSVTGLVATFTTTGFSVSSGGVAQTSGTTPNNFTNPVAYTVTAADGTTATYTVAVTVAQPFDKAITAFSFAGLSAATGIIDESTKSIAVPVPFGTNVTALVATFATTGASVTVGPATQISGTTQNNFTSPMAYTVIAADRTAAIYTVTVIVGAAPTAAKAITAFSFSAFTDSAGAINELTKAITVNVPPGTDVRALVATFASTGAGVKVGTTAQISGTTPNNFTTPVSYTVTAADGTLATYTVTVSLALGPSPVVLGTAGNFVILTKAGITDLPSSAITGIVGVSPIGGTAIGVTCAEVTGTIFSVDAAGPACKVTNPALLTTAVGDMQTAYTNAAGRPAGVGLFLNVGGGTLANRTLVAGTYTWNTAVTITTDLTLNGGPNDIWIFQTSGTLNISPNMRVLLTGGAQAKNIFWQAAGAVTFGTGSHFEGNILALTNIAMLTGASINGRLLAQTAVTLQSNTVTQPGS